MEKYSRTAIVIDVFITFLKLGFTSFGGPIAHLGYFRNELVVRKKWLGESQFSQLLAICQFLPGPASSQLGFSLGFLRAGWLGAIAAFIAFTLPSALLLLAFASLLPTLTGPIAQAAIHGLKIVAFAVVADAVVGMSKKLCPDIQRATIAIVAASILLITANIWVQLLVIISGAFAGVICCNTKPLKTGEQLQLSYGPRSSSLILLLFIGLLAGLPFLASDSGGIWPIANAFYQAGALVFGGGHVVLPLLQDSVVTSGWLNSETFLAGYGASQAIPGPMFAFAAYLGALIPTGQPAWLGASVALLLIFLPGFLLITGVLPLWQRISHTTLAVNGIAGVNAAVVGLLAAALYDPIFTSAINNAADLVIGLIAFSCLAIWRFSSLVAVVWCVLASVVFTLLKH